MMTNRIKLYFANDIDCLSFLSLRTCSDDESMIQQDLKIRSSSCFLACSSFLDFLFCTPGTNPLTHPRLVLHVNIARPPDQISVRVLILILRIEIVLLDRILVLFVLLVRIIEFVGQVGDGLRMEMIEGTLSAQNHLDQEITMPARHAPSSILQCK